MQIILADTQAALRAGTARVLMTQPEIHVAAQCADVEQLAGAIEGLPQSVVLFSSGLTAAPHPLLDRIQRADSRSVMILEGDGGVDEAVRERLDGWVPRSAAGQQLVACLRRAATGGGCSRRSVVKAMPLSDRACSGIVRRLTLKELQIVALLSEGCKNREIANKLGTKEEVVKTYLSSIYAKTGVSDRLELALFTVRHQLLSEVVEATRLALARSA